MIVVVIIGALAVMGLVLAYKEDRRDWLRRPLCLRD